MAMFDSGFKAGDTIRFTYYSEDAQLGSSNVYKEIFVLHPSWDSLMHGLDLKRMTEAERVVIRVIMDPSAENMGSHRIPLINDILKRMDPPELINNPISFYNQFVKPFIRNKDVYRTYYTVSIVNAQVVDATKVQGQMTNPAPLFGKPLGS